MLLNQLIQENQVQHTSCLVSLPLQSCKGSSDSKANPNFTPLPPGGGKVQLYVLKQGGN